jgi:hypothetical protein
MTKLHQTSTLEYFIASFKELVVRTEGMMDALFKEIFISGLKEEFQANPNGSPKYLVGDLSKR